MTADHSIPARVYHLVLLNAFVGAMVGLERTVLPLLAESEFGLTSATAATSFIASFGVSKALVNSFAGALSERWGRRRLLTGGWLLGLPVPVLLMLAPSWRWVLAANVLLGVNQALTWSMTVVMKVDLTEPRHWGRVIGWNEFAGYAGMAVAAAGTGFVAAGWGLRPAPFLLGLGVAVIGLSLSLITQETRPAGVPHVPVGAERRTDRPPRHGTASGAHRDAPPFTTVLMRGTFAHGPLSSASLAGLATNLKDGALWGLLPILLAGRGLSLAAVGMVVALYPMVWAGSQLFFGPLSDRVGQRGLIATGLLVQAAGVAGFVASSSFGAALVAALTVGLGTGMVYPTLLAFVSHQAGPTWRATALGVYRFWRDLGYAAGALLSGLLADVGGIGPSFLGVAILLVLGATVFWIVSGPRERQARSGRP